MTTYLDWNATSPRHAAVTARMLEVEGLAWANPSSVHQAGRAARRLVEDTREALAHLVRVSPRDVVFTSGGTEANHLALSGARWIVTTRTEHPSIVQEVERLGEAGATVRYAEVNADGLLDPLALSSALDDCLEGYLGAGKSADEGGLDNRNTALVAVSAANHETGTIQPIAALSEVTRARGARLHVDAVQLLGRGELSVLESADSISVAAHKLRGPKGVGALCFNCGWTPVPRGRGGAQERGLRAGTVDAAALAGFGEALGRIEASREGYLRAGRLAKLLEAELGRRGADVAIHGAGAQRLGHVVNFRAHGWKGDELVVALDLLGICVSSGSACSAGTAEPSPVIEAMLGRAAATGAVRVSFGEDSTEADLGTLLGALEQLKILTGSAKSSG